MYEKEEKRRVKRRDEVIKEQKHMALTSVLLAVVLLAILYVMLLTFGIVCIALAVTQTNGIIVLILLFSFIALLCFAGCVIATFSLGKGLGQYLAILFDRYTLELDRVELLELKTEAEWTYSTISKGWRRKYVTNQYAYFAKLGKLKTSQKLHQDEECYVFVALTKKPQIVAIYQTDEYLILER